MWWETFMCNINTQLRLSIVLAINPLLPTEPVIMTGYWSGEPAD
jgi:hypothetical protein